MKTASPAEASRREGGARSLWLWVAGGFLLLTLAWVMMFTAARTARVESVPLAPKEVRP